MQLVVSTKNLVFGQALRVPVACALGTSDGLGVVAHTTVLAGPNTPMHSFSEALRRQKVFIDRGVAFVTLGEDFMVNEQAMSDL